MKTIFIALFLLNFHICAMDRPRITSSFYSTFGSYSNSVYSFNLSPVLITNFDYTYFIVLGYDYININGKEWNYYQNNGKVNLIYYSYPLYFDISGGYLKGNFKFKPKLLKDYNYEDDGYYYGASIKKTFFDKFDFGVSFVSSKFKAHSYNFDLDSIFINEAQNFQSSVLLESTFFDKLTLTLKPIYTHNNLNSDLFSTAVSLKFTPVNSLGITYTCYLGNQKFYIDTDMQTIFNQNSVQKSLHSVTLNYFLLNYFSITGNFTYTLFDEYSVNYYTLGVKLFL